MRSCCEVNFASPPSSVKLGLIMENTNASTHALASLLQKRLDVIADKEFRERDPQGHLAALREVSEALDATYQALKPQAAPRLRHFMEQASYSKALEYLSQGGSSNA
jgi:hypothetical protein